MNFFKESVQLNSHATVALYIVLLTACGGGAGSAEVDNTVAPPPREDVNPPQEPAPPRNENPPSEVNPLDSWTAQMKIFAGEFAHNCGSVTGREASLKISTSVSVADLKPTPVFMAATHEAEWTLCLARAWPSIAKGSFLLAMIAIT